MREDLELARKLLEQESCSCVLRRGTFSYISREEGFIPLLLWLDTGMNLKGALAADKKLDCAKAYLYVLLGVSEIYAHAISQQALAVLKNYQIAVQYESSYMDDCELETALQKAEHPEEALKILRAERTELLKKMAASGEEGHHHEET